jgi:hypothetical protein
MVFYCKKFRLPTCKYNGSRVVSIKQNTNFKFQPPSTFVFFFHKNGLVHPLKMYHFIESHWLVQLLHLPQEFERPPF